MRIAMHHSFATSKKESLVELLGRIRTAFLEAGLAQSTLRFTFVDSSIQKGVPVDRVLKRYPEMERFVTFSAVLPGSSESRMISNSTTGEAADYATIQAILTGVPRSFPFSGVWLHFHAPVFGERLIGLPKLGHSLPGVVVTDNWWVTGRRRALSIYTAVEASENAQQLPPNPEPVAAIIKAFGKIKRTEQVPIRAPGGGIEGSIPPANAEAVKAVVTNYRARVAELVERAELPHDLPPAAQVRMQNLAVTAGPRKPALEAAFQPMGYRCAGGSGEFHLTRRTAGNLAIELYLDVGTWSHQVSAIFMVQGSGFKASLPIPVGRGETPAGQYPIGDADQWRRIVENLAALVRELDRSFVPEIEQASGPSPAWFQPT